jgi:hypothetical protein
LATFKFRGESLDFKETNQIVFLFSNYADRITPIELSIMTVINLKTKLGTTLAILTLAVSFGCYRSPSLAQMCVPLDVVGGEGREISKTVSPPGMVLVKDNWNTDFIVASGYPSGQYVATITSKSNGKAKYNVKMFLKYNDGSLDKTFEGDIELTPGQSRNLFGNPRVGQQPYQVNIRVGGVNALGYSYTLAVTSCE